MKHEDLLESLDDKFHISADAVNSDERNHILNHSNTFGVFDRCGNIFPRGQMVQGIYHEGTRYINELVLTINGQKPLLLSSTIKEDNDILSVDLTNPHLADCGLIENTVHISRHQFIRENAFYENIQCVTYGDQECTIVLGLTFNGDFKDIFEIRGISRLVSTNEVVRSAADNEAVLQYLGLDRINRKAILNFSTEAPGRIEQSSAKFLVRLEPRVPVNIRYYIDFKLGENYKPVPDYLKAKSAIQEDLNKNRRLFADIIS